MLLFPFPETLFYVVLCFLALNFRCSKIILLRYVVYYKVINTRFLALTQTRSEFLKHGNEINYLVFNLEEIVFSSHVSIKRKDFSSLKKSLIVEPGSENSRTYFRLKELAFIRIEGSGMVFCLLV